MHVECPDPNRPLTDAPRHFHPVIHVVPPPPLPLTESRRLFERWAMGEFNHRTDIPPGTAPSFGLERARWNPEEYEIFNVQFQWIGWQAAVELRACGGLVNT